MSTLALTADALGVSAETMEKPSLFARLIEAREMAAKRRVAAYLAVQTDQRLADLGYAPDQILALRRARRA